MIKFKAYTIGSRVCLSCLKCSNIIFYVFYKIILESSQFVIGIVEAVKIIPLGLQDVIFNIWGIERFQIIQVDVIISNKFS